MQLQTLGFQGKIILKARYDFRNGSNSPEKVGNRLETAILDRSFGETTAATIIDAVNRHFRGSYSPDITQIDDQRITDFIIRSFPTQKEVLSRDIDRIAQENTDYFSAT